MNYADHPLLKDLNEPQRQAVLHGDGPLLIFAGAGSGKTRTLTRRIAWLTTEGGVPPYRILAVTFTNKAAREMRERVEALCGAEARSLWMGTFHSLCARMLRISGHLISIPAEFVIFDTDDSLRLIKEILTEAQTDSERYPPARILARISDAKNNLRSVDEVEGTAASPMQKLTARVMRRYEERLRSARALDFDDLLLRAVQLLEQSEEARTQWCRRFQHVLVDEFQDVNLAQSRWTQLLVQQHRNICVVGDDDQSIYAWRGADVQIILDFEKHYPEATIIHLEQNYRSTQPILEAAHAVISRNRWRQPKKLWTDRSGGEGLHVQGLNDGQEEALWVARTIHELQRNQQRRWSDFAILCRVNAQSRPVEEAFMRSRIPLRLIGTQRFYERKEIRDLIAYLKLVQNPYDPLALQRALGSPPRGIGEATLRKLEEAAASRGLSLFEAMQDKESRAVLGPAAAGRVAHFANTIVALRNSRASNPSVQTLLQNIIDSTGFQEHLQKERDRESIDRLANVDEFVSAAALHDERMQSELLEIVEDEGIIDVPLSTFLEMVALEANTDASTAGKDADAVTLMTLHSAKGLEFPLVFLIGMEQGLLPHGRALWGENSDEQSLEEERRLCYVGLTRARERVYLSYAARRTLHGRTEWTQPSQFLGDIPGHLLRRAGLATGGVSALEHMTTWNSPASVPGEDEDAPPPTYEIGDRVRHPTFGEGEVVNTSKRGGDGEWVEVCFAQPGVGTKKLVLAYAPLQRM